MEALILSCSTGGGHNAAGYAVKEELERRGHHVTMLDPYSLAGKHMDQIVADGYVRIAQKTPHMFGVIYKLGDWYRKLPIHSPVYVVNKAMVKKMRPYLDSHHYDVILMPHVYPGEILTYMKNRGIPIPKLIFIATDYVCTPFTEETDCDYYIAPAEDLIPDFVRRKIAREKLVPAGIPVKRSFWQSISREEALERLGLDPAYRYLLLSGGSIGAGQIGKTIRILKKYLESRPEQRLIVICGSHGSLREKLEKLYGDDPQIILLASTDKMHLYMKGSDICLTKPGGLSSTEAAVAGVPLIHISPIPGCEKNNMAYFADHGMSIAVGSHLKKLLPALEQMRSPAAREAMLTCQRAGINPHAAEEICDLAEKITKKDETA